MKFSANLGFLWAQLPLDVAIRRAHAAGFNAVEMHWPFASDRAAVKQALADTGLPLMGLNTDRGPAGQNGWCALVGQTQNAHAAIDQALDWAADLGAANVHVMAGFAEGIDAQQTFLDNLHYAADQGAPRGVGILIEPLNRFDAPGYFLKTQAQAVEVLQQLDRDNVRLMFDCYHVARTEGDVIATFDRVRPWIGHVQFAGAPDRAEPDRGTLDCAQVLAHIVQSGWDRPLGAEYKPAGDIDAGLGWLARFQDR